MLTNMISSRVLLKGTNSGISGVTVGVTERLCQEGWIMAKALARPLVAVGFALMTLMIGLATVTAMAGPLEDLNKYNQEHGTLKSSFASVLERANAFLESSKKGTTSRSKFSSAHGLTRTTSWTLETFSPTCRR